MISNLTCRFFLITTRPSLFGETWSLDWIIRGTKVHDARIAATLLGHGIAYLLTWDGGDFKRYTFLTCITPEQVLDGTLPT